MEKTRVFALALAALTVATTDTVHAQVSDGIVRIGVLNDQSGVFKDLTGRGSTIAAEMAVEDFGAGAHDLKVEVLSADHQNKADVGSSIARRWIESQGVDVIADVPNSSVALAVSQIVRDANKVLLVSGAATSRLTGDACTPNTIHWTYDNWALANSTATAVMASGGRSWFFITADYAFGHDLEAQTSQIVKAAGGMVVGSVRHPPNTADFSSFLLQAQASRADIIALANGGTDTANAVKQAQQFAIDKSGQKLALLTGTIYDVHALGLEAAHGLLVTELFYWDTDEGTRAFTRRFTARHDGRYPTMMHAGVYSSVLHYLRAVAALKGDSDGAGIVARMKSTPTDDPAFGRGQVRADGRKIHPGYLFEVKTPRESTGPWDYYKLRATILAENAFRPLAQSECPLARSK